MPYGFGETTRINTRFVVILQKGATNSSGISSFSKTFMEITSSTVANLLQLLLVRPLLRLEPHVFMTLPGFTAYQVAQKQRKAMGAFERAHAWQELFTIATNEGIDASDLAALGVRVSGAYRLLSTI